MITVTGEDDQAMAALEELIRVLEGNAKRVEQILERAGRLRARREAGIGWVEAAKEMPGPLIVEMLTRNIEGLHEASARFRRAHARALRAEGMSIEQIASRFGVSRQRISALLSARDAPPQTFGSYSRAAGVTPD
jgi:hypothetical protein